MGKIQAALEIGTAKTVLAIGETQQDGRVKVISLSEIPSSGVRKSQVAEIQNVAKSITSVLRESEKKQLSQGKKITIVNAYHVVSGAHIGSEIVSSSVQVQGGRVTQRDVDEAKAALSNSIAIPKTQEVLSFEYLGFEINGMNEISNPVGMSGDILHLYALIIYADANSLNNARTAAETAKLELEDPLFSATAAAEAVLEEHEKKNGVLVIDFGGGSTSYAVYANSYLVTAGSLGVGGSHVTNDIAFAFQISYNTAENMKINEASALASLQTELPARIKPGESSIMETRTFSRRALNTVTNARLRETISILREKLKEQNLLHKLLSGVVLVGGGARMKDLDTLVEQQLGANVRFGKPIHVDGLENEEHSERFAAVAGALLIANGNDEKKSFVDIFKGLFK